MPSSQNKSRHISPPAITGIRSKLPIGAYGRLFRTLPPWGAELENHEARQALDALAQSMIVGEDAVPDLHPSLPAGYTYLGALITHDITFDPATVHQRQVDPDRLANSRTPALDLDCIYGRGPQDQPYLYEEKDLAKFRIGLGKSEREQDLPRIGEMALIGDPRNDENLIVSQLHLAFLKFHNEIVDFLDGLALAQGYPPADRLDTFLAAQRLARWHYQWVVIHDFLARILDPEVFSRLLDTQARHRVTKKPDLFYFRPTTSPYIPIEFSAAAFRFGHSIARSAYRLSQSLQDDYRDEIFRDTEGMIPIFLQNRDDQHSRLKANSPGTFVNQGELKDLSGVRQLPIGWGIDWREFFDTSFSYPYQRAMRVNANISRELTFLPGSVANPSTLGKISSLPHLDMIKGLKLELPSGQAVAQAMGVHKVYSNAELGISNILPGNEAPLSFYILKESELQFEGLRLGRVGSEIIGEVLFGLILYDPDSFASVNPNWRPTLGSSDEKFRMSDLLSFTAFDQLAAEGIPPSPFTSPLPPGTAKTPRLTSARGCPFGR